MGPSGKKTKQTLSPKNSSQNNEGIVIKGFIVSMDHSVSEQLTGNPSEWHTTVLVMSEGGEHSAAARTIAEGMNLPQRGLKKWSRTGPNYRRKFLESLAKTEVKPSTEIFAISAQEFAIEDYLKIFLSEFGLEKMFSRFKDRKGRSVIMLEPVFEKDGKKTSFSMLETQFSVILWIVHFCIRMHRLQVENFSRKFQKEVPVDWFFYMDRFAGDDEKKTARGDLFRSLTRSMINGNMITSTFNVSDSVDSDLFADNLAGLLNGGKKNPGKYPEIGKKVAASINFWECFKKKEKM